VPTGAGREMGARPGLPLRSLLGWHLHDDVVELPVILWSDSYGHMVQVLRVRYYGRVKCNSAIVHEYMVTWCSSTWLHSYIVHELYRPHEIMVQQITWCMVHGACSRSYRWCMVLWCNGRAGGAVFTWPHNIT
jgi:hypothetical protein